MRFFELSVPACLPTCLPVCPWCDAVIVTILHSILTLTLTLTTPLFLSASALPVNDNDKSGAGIHEREGAASLSRPYAISCNQLPQDRTMAEWVGGGGEGGGRGSSKAARPKPSCVFVCRLHQRKKFPPKLDTCIISYHSENKIPTETTVQSRSRRPSRFRFPFFFLFLSLFFCDA